MVFMRLRNFVSTLCVLLTAPGIQAQDGIALLRLHSEAGFSPNPSFHPSDSSFHIGLRQVLPYGMREWPHTLILAGLPFKKIRTGLTLERGGPLHYRVMRLRLYAGKQLFEHMVGGIGWEYKRTGRYDLYPGRTSQSPLLGIWIRITGQLSAGLHLADPQLWFRDNRLLYETHPMIGAEMLWHLHPLVRLRLEAESSHDPHTQFAAGLTFKAHEDCELTLGKGDRPGTLHIGLLFRKTAFICESAIFLHPTLGATPFIGLHYAPQ